MLLISFYKMHIKSTVDPFKVIPVGLKSLLSLLLFIFEHELLIQITSESKMCVYNDQQQMTALLSRGVYEFVQFCKNHINSQKNRMGTYLICSESQLSLLQSVFEHEELIRRLQGSNWTVNSCWSDQLIQQWRAKWLLCYLSKRG